jgi:hypothetical protein
MVGRKPKQSGRIVVRDEDVAAFESVGWVAIEPTSLPLSGRPVPGQKQPTEAEMLKANSEDMLAKIEKANTPQLKKILEENGVDADIDALALVAERREAVKVALGLVEPTEEDDVPDADEYMDEDGE